MENEEQQELEAGRIRLAVYKKIIEKYEDFINASEEKTIPELKAMVTDKAPSVTRVKKELLSQIAVEEAAYSFERDFLRYAERAYSFVQLLKPIHAELSVSFWLSYENMLELKAADSFDKALFCCSLLYAGGCKTAKVRVIELEGGLKHPVVVFFFQEKQHLFDPSQECSAFTFQGVLEEVFAGFTFEGRAFVRSLYEFNSEDYFEFE